MCEDEDEDEDFFTFMGEVIPAGAFGDGAVHPSVYQVFKE